MLFKNITIIDENLDVKKNMFVLVQDGRIAYVGAAVPEGYDGEMFDGSRKLLMSALINIHAHSPMTLLRGYGEGMALSDWLFTKIFPFEAKMRERDVYYSMLLGIAEMMKYGTAASTEMYFHTDAIVRAALESGFKINISSGITSFDGKPLSENANFLCEQKNFETIHGAGGGRILADFSIHGEYTSNPGIVGGLAAYLKGKDARVHIHLSETKKEVAECRERHGITPPAYFEKLGLFDLPVTAAHCVALEDGDFDILSRHDVTIAHCPVSNLKLASGVANIPRALRAGISVGLGTDGPSSNNALNLFSDLKLFALLHKGVGGDPKLIGAKEALLSVTANGARAQGRADCGVLKAGARADLVVIDLDTPSMQPEHDLVSNIVYSLDPSAIFMTMIDGQVVYRDGEFKTIDLEKVYFEVESSKKRILSEL
ncbi:MAG: amidohydrolase [Clostridia bacterium]|nr:amidohydrolase [Clostridia bacterium]